jgi:hypothetical protein
MRVRHRPVDYCFLERVEGLHASRVPGLRAILERDGRSPLHVDATGEDGRGTMLVAFHLWRRPVLGAWEFPAEGAEFIDPLIQSIAASFGTPRAMRKKHLPIKKH